MIATIAGYAISAATLTLPKVGAWVLEATLVDAAALSGGVSVTIGDLTLAGSVVRGGAFDGSARYLVTAGAGGWHKAITGRPEYRNDLGVKLSAVLADDARAAGETIALDPALDRVLGTAYVRRAGLGWDVLGSARLALPWWVDAAGVTQVRARPAAAVTAPSQLIAWDRVRGIREYGADTFAPFAPGATIDGDTIAEVTITISAAAARVRVRS